MRLFLAALILTAIAGTFAGDADADHRRWFVQTSDNKIVSFTDDDGGVAPDGTTEVADSVIRAADPPGATGDILPLGTWDGTTYTAPSGGGIVVHIDPATGQGSVQMAAHAMMDVFENGLAFVQDNRAVWSHTNIKKATDAIYWMQVNAARVALNSTRTAANRVKFLEEAASWPSGLSGEVRQLVDYFADGIAAPTKDFSWVNSETTPPERTGAAMWASGFSNATNVETAPASAKLLGRAWIADIQ